MIFVQSTNERVYVITTSERVEYPLTPPEGSGRNFYGRDNSRTCITTSGRVYLVNLNNYERESRVPSNAPRG